MKKIILLIISLIGLSLLSGCATQDSGDKVSCEQSGGEYVKGVSSSGGFYYCSCPIEKYEDGNKCKAITQELKDLCSDISNNYVDCIDALPNYSYFDYYGEGVCQCTFKDSGTISYLKYEQILNCAKCHCNEDACMCMCAAER